MKVNLSFVPPGGGKTEYSMSIEMPDIPRQGDYISVTRPGQTGAENFIVMRTWWDLEFDESGQKGTTREIWVECQFAVSSNSSDSHKRTCSDYQAKSGRFLRFDESMY